MALRLTYQMFSTLLGRIVVRVWIVLRIRADTSKDIEILVLRHQAGQGFLLVCPVGHLRPHRHPQQNATD